VKQGWRDRRLLDRLAIEAPIVQAPMAGAQDEELAIASIRGGALGSLPCALLPADMIRDQVAKVRAAAPGPLNLNFFCHDLPDRIDDRAWLAALQPYYDEYGVGPPAAPPPLRRPFDDAMCTLVEEVRPDVVSFHFGLPAPALVERVRATGALVLASATSLAEARWLAERGVDGVIAQGWEAGGHAGRFLGAPPEEQMGLFALVPQVADETGLPVVAAGGIGDARGIAAALLLGAAAVQLGTLYLHCPECHITPAHREGLSAESAERTRFTNLYSGGLGRGLPSPLTERLGPVRFEAPPFPLASVALAPLGLRPMWAGQAARLGRTEPARALTERLGREALALLDGSG
jgi:nitronate monooxygenase